MPENTITRQDLITLAYRAFLAKGYIEETSDFTALDVFGDKDSISDYALAQWLLWLRQALFKAPTEM